MEKTALVIIDAQRGLIEGLGGHDPIWKGADLLHNIRGLLDRARDAGAPVVFVQDDDVAPPESEGWEVHPAIAPLADEARIRKLATDSFHKTRLNETLRNLEITRLVIAGCKTEYCIDTACRRGTTLGYQVILAADAHSTTEDGVLTAEQIIAHHNRNLNGLDNVDRYIQVLPSEEIVFG